MPNWCENTIDFTGPKEEIAKLHQAVETANLNNYVSPIPQELKEDLDLIGKKVPLIVVGNSCKHFIARGLRPMVLGLSFLVLIILAVPFKKSTC